MSKDNDKLYGILVSIAFHLVIILVLAISYLRANEYKEVPVSLDRTEYFAGGGSPAPSQGTSGPQQPAANLPASPPPSAPPSRNSDPVITAPNNEEATIAAAKRKQEAEERRQREAEETRRKAEEAERIRKAEAERRQASDIANSVSGAFAGGSGTGSGAQGSSSGNGAGDNPFGNSGQGGGSGTGFGSFSLSGRSLEGGLPRPAFPIPEDGVIVLVITVNPQGEVISATIGPGTKNITSESIRQSAIAAAKKTRFNPISSPSNQIGTITYNYEITR